MRAPAPRAPFVLLVSTLLTAGLVALLLMHTTIAEDSFRLHDLTSRSTVLADQEQALEQEIALAEAPQRLAARAKALGMVRSENPAFIRTSDGRILGKPKAGVLPPVIPPVKAAGAPAPARPSEQPGASQQPGPTPTGTRR